MKNRLFHILSIGEGKDVMNISIEPILIEQKSVFIQMMELYQYDFSEFSDDDINEYGYYG